MEQKEAVVHIVDTENVENTNETAALLNRNESELTRTTFDTVESLSVSVPGLKQSKVRFEAVLHDTMAIKKDDKPVSDLILLEIKHYHFDDAIYNDGYINKDELSAVSRLAGNDYAEIGRTFTIERP